MRNVEIYPATREEIIKALENVQIDPTTADLPTICLWLLGFYVIF